MNNQDYEQKKRECWENVKFALRAPNTAREVFEFIFDRAYALGKEKETITQEEIEEAAEKYADPSRTWASGAETQEIKDAFKAGANFALGKQEKDAEKQEALTCEKSKVLYRFRMAEACKIGNNPESDYWIGYSKAIQDLFGLEGEPCVTPKDADTVIQGWVARDKDGDVFLYQNEPDRNEIAWDGYMMRSLPIDSFPDLTWESDPEPVEITIKRKNHE